MEIKLKIPFNGSIIIDLDKIGLYFMKILQNLRVHIKEPGNDKEVSQKITVKGTVSRQLKTNEHLWLVVNPWNSHGWYPQTTEIAISHNGFWEREARIGQGNEDLARKFQIVVVVANDNAHQAFNQYLKKGWETKEWPEESLPIGVIQLDAITVTRK